MRLSSSEEESPRGDSFESMKGKEKKRKTSSSMSEHLNRAVEEVMDELEGSEF
jgi:hypothetical protein